MYTRPALSGSTAATEVTVTQVMRLLMVFGLLFCGCGRKQEPLPVSGEIITTPYQQFGKTTLILYDQATKKWKLDTDFMKKNLDDTAKTLVVPVRIVLFDSSGQPGTRILADSGFTDGKLESFLVWGAVNIHTEDGKVIDTERLSWNKNAHKVASDTYVQIRTAQGDVLRGKGLDAAEDFSRWSFKSQVSGKFPDFRKRVENDEQIF